ncbi:hypothetical protein VNO77_32780 [Canavalia gladiata]|uniref:Uncharacterized protein n=1 Tax=Canavalia gladiata TaxID=3824 RepID=A0AAN9Q591_CANGL
MRLCPNQSRTTLSYSIFLHSHLLPQHSLLQFFVSTLSLSSFRISPSIPTPSSQQHQYYYPSYDRHQAAPIYAPLRHQAVPKTKSPMDVEPKRIRLQSNSYTTNTLLGAVTAGTIQFILGPGLVVFPEPDQKKILSLVQLYNFSN